MLMNYVFTLDSVFKLILLKTQNSHKILQQVYQSSDNLLQLAETVYYGREYEERKERQRKTKEQADTVVMAVRTVLKQSEKNSWRDPGEKRWTCYYYGKKGHLKRDCPQASKATPRSMSGLQGTTLEESLHPEA